MEKKRSVGVIALIISLCIFALLFIELNSVAEAKEKKDTLVFVGDAALTYASYFFELPQNWMSEMRGIQELVHQKGFWRGKHRESNVWITIAPTKIRENSSPAEFINRYKALTESRGGDWLIKNYNFTPSFAYPYELHLEYSVKSKSYILVVFAKLPTHVVNFNLSVLGVEDENSITPFLDDFNKVIASFRWTLGLSDEEIGKMLKSIQ